MVNESTIKEQPHRRPLRASIHDIWPKHGEFQPDKERDPMTPFGARLRALRKSKGLTQIALGARADMHQQAVQQIEMGRRKPTPYTMTRLADALSVPIDLLAGPGVVSADPDEWAAFRDALADVRTALDRLQAAARVIGRENMKGSP
jgi:transcriptional regulator with XRE-family HTH domain